MVVTIGGLTPTTSAAQHSDRNAEMETWSIDDGARWASRHMAVRPAAASTFGFSRNQPGSPDALAVDPQPVASTTQSPTQPQHSERGLPFVPSSYRVDALKSWTGVVRELDAEYFVAELDETDGNTSFMAEFERTQLGIDEDLELGDVVYVTVRSVQNRFGPSRTTSVRMRRLGRWSQEEIDSIHAAARTEAAELQQLLGD